ncbi:hypothetical protein FSP39_006629 [Pinctada imbricata]|uniref:Uncharacterized protein n=1 Tax=Pinctada imbricata TaxID=66713 RepID=A0AA89BNT1_PINIB|nr:hypothetical protein FSP39_006629 [Pinctada imbricata]
MKVLVTIILWICILQLVLTRPDVLTRRQDVSRRQDMPLDVQKLEALGKADTLMQSLKDIAQHSHNCGVKEIPRLRRHYLKNSSITCNDRSKAGYYLRKSYGSKKWIVFLEGGWYCFNTLSCKLRWGSKMKTFMSSKLWPEQRSAPGILSWDPAENPYYFNANIVYIPYCSSDTWTGTNFNEGGDFAFLGSYIVEEVIKELIPRGLKRARKLFLTGSSAGGTGVLMNLDRVADQMAILAPRVEVRGIADSGWFIDDIPQFRTSKCSEPLSCSPVDGIKLGYRLWNGRVPDRCKESNPWLCYFGYRMYPTLKTPVFIVQYLFDEAQIMVNNLIDQSYLMTYNGNDALFSKEQWEYLYRLGEQVKNTLENVSAVFAPACLSHELIVRKDWHSVSVDGVTVAQSIYCWENSFGREKCLSSTTRSSNSVQLVRPYRDAPVQGNTVRKPKSKRKNKKKKKKRRKKGKKRKKNKRRRRRKNKKNRKRKGKGRKKKKKRRRQRKKTRAQRSARNISNCSHHLIELCPLPQWCNNFCPAFRNVFTGKEIDFFKLFAVSGIDAESIAQLLDVDKSIVHRMNSDTISELLLDTFRHKNGRSQGAG